MMMKISPDQARALALVVNGIRTDWDPQGIFTAIGKARDLGDIAAVATAAIKAASNPANRTPAVIAMQGPHWTATGTPTTNPVSGDPCPIHDVRPAHNCHCCRADFLAVGSWPAGSLHHQAQGAA